VWERASDLYNLLMMKGLLSVDGWGIILLMHRLAYQHIIKATLVILVFIPLLLHCSVYYMHLPSLIPRPQTHCVHSRFGNETNDRVLKHWFHG